MNIVQLTSKLEGTMSTLECRVVDLVHSYICHPKYVEYVCGMIFFRAFVDAFSRKLVFISLKWLVHLMFLHNFKQWLKSSWSPQIILQES